MQTPVLQAFAPGNLTPWAQTLFKALEKNLIIDVSYEANLDRFLATNFPHHRIPVVLVENSKDGKKVIQTLRKSGKPFFFLWFGRAFTTEELLFAIRMRIYQVFSNARPDDPDLTTEIRSVSVSVENAERFEQCLHSMKSLLVETEEPDEARTMLGELRNAVHKIETNACQNEFSRGQPGTEKMDKKEVPFFSTPELTDALMTAHDLERTGTLWIRSSTSANEGKIEFLQGKAVGASTGEATGLKAIFRMFLWDEPRFLFTRGNPESITVDEEIHSGIKHICLEGEELRRRFQGIRKEIPPPDLRLEIDTHSLHPGSQLNWDEFMTLAAVVEFGKVSEIIDYTPLPDVMLYECLIYLRRNNFLVVPS